MYRSRLWHPLCCDGVYGCCAPLYWKMRKCFRKYLRFDDVCSISMCVLRFVCDDFGFGSMKLLIVIMDCYWKPKAKILLCPIITKINEIHTIYNKYRRKKRISLAFYQNRKISRFQYVKIIKNLPLKTHKNEPK